MIGGFHARPSYEQGKQEMTKNEVTGKSQQDKPDTVPFSESRKEKPAD